MIQRVRATRPHSDSNQIDQINYCHSQLASKGGPPPASLVRLARHQARARQARQVRARESENEKTKTKLNLVNKSCRPAVVVVWQVVAVAANPLNRVNICLQRRQCKTKQNTNTTAHKANRAHESWRGSRVACWRARWLPNSNNNYNFDKRQDPSQSRPCTRSLITLGAGLSWLQLDCAPRLVSARGGNFCPQPSSSRARLVPEQVGRPLPGCQEVATAARNQKWSADFRRVPARSMTP